jgi:hypothetical protein
VDAYAGARCVCVCVGGGWGGGRGRVGISVRECAPVCLCACAYACLRVCECVCTQVCRRRRARKYTRMRACVGGVVPGRVRGWMGAWLGRCVRGWMYTCVSLALPALLLSRPIISPPPPMSIRVSARANRAVVGPHGAGLANLVACGPGTRVVEIGCSLSTHDGRSSVGDGPPSRH